MSLPSQDFDYLGKALDDVFTSYGKLRAECPVGWSDRYGGFWFLAKYDDIWAAEQDPDSFSVAPGMLFPSLGNERPLIPLDIDPPQLQRYRRMLLPAFTASRMERLEPYVRSIANELIDQLAGKEVFDASLEYARLLSMIVFGEMAGLPRADNDRFQSWVERTLYGRTEDPDDAAAAAKEVETYFRELRRDRLTSDRKDDLIGRLLQSDADGRVLGEDEFADYCLLLLIAGLETSAWSIRSALWHLAQHPEDRRRLVTSPELIVPATEEFLRCMAPVQGMARTVKREIEVRGQRIPAGERVVLMFGSANRDEEVFETADQVVIDRRENPHLAFGVGAHRCLGSNLGRREVRIGLEELLQRVPDFELVDTDTPWWGIGPLRLRQPSAGAANPGIRSANGSRGGEDR